MQVGCFFARFSCVRRTDLCGVSSLFEGVAEKKRGGLGPDGVFYGMSDVFVCMCCYFMGCFVVMCLFLCLVGVLEGVFSVKNDEIGKYGVKNLGVCLEFLYICGVMVCLMGCLGVFVRFFGEWRLFFGGCSFFIFRKRTAEDEDGFFSDEFRQAVRLPGRGGAGWKAVSGGFVCFRSAFPEWSEWVLVYC